MDILKRVIPSDWVPDPGNVPMRDGAMLPSTVMLAAQR